MSPLERGDTLAYFSTLGSPLPLLLGGSTENASATGGLEVPAPAILLRWPWLRGGWTNFYHRQDVTAYPLQAPPAPPPHRRRTAAAPHRRHHHRHHRNVRRLVPRRVRRSLRRRRTARALTFTYPRGARGKPTTTALSSRSTCTT